MHMVDKARQMVGTPLWKAISFWSLRALIAVSLAFGGYWATGMQNNINAFRRSIDKQLTEIRATNTRQDDERNAIDKRLSHYEGASEQVLRELQNIENRLESIDSAIRSGAGGH